MKKKFTLLLCLFSMLCVFSLSGINTGFVYADEQAVQTDNVDDYFSYEKVSDTYIISSSETETNYTTIGEVLSAIKTNSAEADNILIELSNLNISESIKLSFDATFSGSITSTETGAIFIIESNTKIIFNNITINGTGSHLIETDDNSENCSIQINSGTFSSTKNNSYTIYFYGTRHTLKFGGIINNSCKFFTKAKTGVTITVANSLFEIDENETKTSESSTLNIVLPYDADLNFIAIYFALEIYSTNYNYISLVPPCEGSFSVEQQTNKTDDYYFWTAYAKINLNYDKGMGETSSTDYDNYFFYNSKDIVFPSNLTLNLYDFNGWFGKFYLSDELKVELNIEQNYLYYDAYALKNYVENGYPQNEILSYFKVSAEDCDPLYPLMGYTYNSSTENLDIEYYQTYFGIVFMLDNDQKVELVAGYSKQTFEISFETNGGSEVSDIISPWGELLTAPENPTKTGYSFAGWFTDESLTDKYEFSEDTMMGTSNITLYASWTKNTYNITLHYNNESENSTVSFLYDEEINIDEPERVGYNFAGWFTDENLTEQFTLTTMPAENLNLYASWQIQTFNVIFNSNGGTNYVVNTVEYGSTVSEPATPEKIGSSFLGWYTDNGTFLNEYDFNTQIVSNLTLYAKWYVIEYTITFNSNSGSYVEPIHAAAGSTLDTLDTPTLTGYKFIGWYTDEMLTEEFNLTTMPPNNITLYAKWELKTAIILDLQVQSYDYEEVLAYYKNFSDISGFAVYYFVDNTWTTSAPTNAGTYDIKVTRAEDNNYQAYEQVFEKVFVINHVELNLSWVYAILFSFALIEAAVVIILRHMKKMKTSKVYALLPIIINKNYMIPNNQFVLILVSAILALVGFVCIIFMLVDLHRTAKNDAFLPSNLDNRERFKEDLTFQNENNGDDDYFVGAKSDESFGDKYSEEDIKNMLSNDTFADSIAERRKFNVQDNSSINWNQMSETDGSDVVFKAREMDEVAGGAYDNRTPVKFFDDGFEEDDENAEQTQAEPDDNSDVSKE